MTPLAKLIAASIEQVKRKRGIPMTVDTHCWDLAELFVEDNIPPLRNKEEATRIVAEAIQRTIEETLGDLSEPERLTRHEREWYGIKPD